MLVKYGIPEVREVSRNLPGARGFAVIEYRPMASHGDPIQAQNHQLLMLRNVYPFRFVNVFLEKILSGER